MLRVCVSCLLASVVGLAPVSLVAQVPSGALAGRVLDTTGARLPRAMVRLLSSTGTEVARTLTDSQGRFRFTGLAIVTYRVEAALTGFESTSVTATPNADLKLVLRVEPVRESIIVTATRTQAPTGQLGASSSVVSAREIRDRQLLSVSGLLQSATSATAVRSGGLGTLTSLFVRGGESDHTKVLLDGIPLNEPGGFFNFSNLTVENLERVEVVRGPQSALFGSDAMAGVVQLFTRRGRAETARPRFSLSFEGGNNDTWRGRGGLSGGAGRVDYALQWARLSTDNREPNSFFHNTTLSGNAGWALGERTTLRLILRGELGRVGTPGQTAFGRPDRDAFFRRRDGFGGLAVRNHTASFWEQRLTYAFAKSRQLSRNLIEDPPFTPVFEDRAAPFQFFDFPLDFLSDFRRHHLSYQSDWRGGSLGRALGQHVLTFAFEWDRERGLLGERLSAGTPTRAQRDNLGWTLQHQALWGRLFLANGVRIDDNDSFGVSVVPRSSLAYFVRHGNGPVGSTKLKFNFGLGIKEPSFLESFSPSPSFLGNPDLSPERTRSFDFGVEQRFWRERGKLEVNWFDNRFRDLIAFQVVSFSPFQGSFFNIGRSKAKGAEVILELAPGAGLRGIGSYTFLDSQVTRSASPFSAVFREGQSLFRRPRHSGSLRVFWDWRRLNITSSTVFVGRRVDSDFAALEPPLTSNQGYTKWDLAWSYRSSYRVTYFGVMENLLNQDYMEALGFRALKLTFRAGARVEF